MFVLKSTHDKLQKRNQESESKLEKLETVMDLLVKDQISVLDAMIETGEGMEALREFLLEKGVIMKFNKNIYEVGKRAINLQQEEELQRLLSA